MDSHENPYDILGVDQCSTSQEIKTAYRKLALKHHPDKQSTEADRSAAANIFQKISNAYEILGDERTRREYDEQLQAQLLQEYQNKRNRNMSRNTRIPSPTPSFHYSFHDPFQVFAQVFRNEFHPNASHSHRQQQHNEGSFFSPFPGPGIGLGLGSMFHQDPFFRQHSQSQYQDPFFQQVQQMQQMQNDFFSDGYHHPSMQHFNSNTNGGRMQSYSCSSSSSTRIGPNGTREQITTNTVNGQTTVETVITHPDGTVEQRVETHGPNHNAIADGQQPQQQHYLEGSQGRYR